MALPFLQNASRKLRDQMVAVDLGSRTTKAVHVQRRGDNYALCGYQMSDAPVYEKTLSAELLTEHLKTVAASLGAKTKLVVLTVGVNDALLRSVEMPVLPPDDMRLVLKHNSRNYLQQDLSNYVFDCHVINGTVKPAAAVKGAASAKQKVLVVGARRQLVDDFVQGAKGAGLLPDHIVPGLIGPVNAFELAMPEVFKNEVVALVDIGFKHSTICILQKGEMILSRTVAIGGDRLTTSLSESMTISYAEAEGIKVGMAHEVQQTLEATLTPLGRELRASIDFFEHQQDKAVSQVYVSGGSARSAVILQALQGELLVECKTWNPTSFLEMELSPEQTSEIEHVGPQLAVALGAALAAL
ncbi:MAG: type pilus assembly protein PilM [Verrucomicrobiota bacterium]